MVTFFVAGVNTCINGGNVTDVVEKNSIGADTSAVIGIAVVDDVKIRVCVGVIGGC